MLWYNIYNGKCILENDCLIVWLNSPPEKQNNSPRYARLYGCLAEVP